MPENSTHKCANAVNNVQPIRNSSHMVKILSVYNSLQAGDYENGNGGKRRVSRLTQFIRATLQLSYLHYIYIALHYITLHYISSNTVCLWKKPYFGINAGAAQNVLSVSFNDSRAGLDPK